VPISSRVPVVKIAAVLAIVAITFAGNFLWIRVVVHVVPPIAVQAIRFLAAGAVLFAIAIPRSRSPRPTLAQWKRAATASTLLVAIGQGCVSWAEQYVSAGTTVLVVCTIPIWVAILGAIFFRERVAPLAIAGIAIGFAGLLPIVFANGTPAPSAMAGIATLFVSALAWSIGSLYTNRFAIHSDGLVATAMQLTIGGALLAVVTIGSGEAGAIRFAAIDATVLEGMAYLIVVGGVVAYTAYIWLLRNAKPTVAATFVYVQAVIGVALGALLLHEPVPPGILAGGAAVILGVGCVIAGRR
jgi:drug/metabolite transporter (DMT)-like permease